MWNVLFVIWCVILVAVMLAAGVGWYRTRSDSGQALGSLPSDMSLVVGALALVSLVISLGLRFL